jgi:hypothetical protein
MLNEGAGRIAGMTPAWALNHLATARWEQKQKTVRCRGLERTVLASHLAVDEKDCCRLRSHAPS